MYVCVDTRREIKYSEYVKNMMVDDSKYTGEIKNGKPHGQGTMTLENKTQYMGIWDNGKKRGLFNIKKPNGSPETKFYT